MIVSMTGYAAVAAELPGVSLSVELRSVNHRYLDLQLRVPDELRGIESQLRERIAAESRRGKIECRVGLCRSAPGVPRRLPSRIPDRTRIRSAPMTTIETLFACQ